jgi:allophanate hydrolase
VTLEEIAAEPVAAHSRLGTYTNFVNLLDLCAIAVPGRDRSDGRPSGVTLIGKPAADGLVAAIGRRMHARAAGAMGATGHGLPPLAEAVPAVPRGWIALAVVGAHLTGMPLNRVVTDLGGVFVRADRTARDYAFYALAGGPPFRPGLIRVGEGAGASIELEVWALPPEGFGRFVDTIPPPLGIGTVRLADGTPVRGFICEGAGIEGATDITAFGGWRAYLATRTAAA